MLMARLRYAEYYGCYAWHARYIDATLCYVTALAMARCFAPYLYAAMLFIFTMPAMPHCRHAATNIHAALPDYVIITD